MMQKATMILTIILLSLTVKATAAAQTSGEVTRRVQRLLAEIQADSYPELKDAKIEIQLFDSSSDYFQTRFTFRSFLFNGKLRYLLRVNRNLLAQDAPDEGIRAILAHELGHVVYYKSRNRLALLGLMRLACKDFTARFERATDLEAITHGYGEGLKSYRLWLYAHISPKKLAEKKRNYFSPEELDALQLKLRAYPPLLEQWRKQPPRSLDDIQKTAMKSVRRTRSFENCVRKLMSEHILLRPLKTSNDKSRLNYQTGNAGKFRKRTVAQPRQGCASDA